MATKQSSEETEAEDGFDLLDAPVMRLAPPNVPVPFSPPLEDAYLPQVDQIVEAVQELSNGSPRGKEVVRCPPP